MIKNIGTFSSCVMSNQAFDECQHGFPTYLYVFIYTLTKHMITQREGQTTLTSITFHWMQCWWYKHLQNSHLELGTYICSRLFLNEHFQVSTAELQFISSFSNKYSNELYVETNYGILLHCSGLHNEFVYKYLCQ